MSDERELTPWREASLREKSARRTILNWDAVEVMFVEIDRLRAEVVRLRAENASLTKQLTRDFLNLND